MRLSRASRSCGLKFVMAGVDLNTVRVTSFTLVWIKIGEPTDGTADGYVTSFTLVWIKI